MQRTATRGTNPLHQMTQGSAIIVQNYLLNVDRTIREQNVIETVKNRISTDFLPSIMSYNHQKLQNVVTLMNTHHLEEMVNENQGDWICHAGYRAVHWAANRGNYRAIQILSTVRGFDPNIHNVGGNPPLHTAICQVSDPRVLAQTVTALINAGANANGRSHNGHLPLQYAIDYFGARGEPVYRALMQGSGTNRANPNYVDTSGYSAHHYARINYGITLPNIETPTPQIAATVPNTPNPQTPVNPARTAASQTHTVPNTTHSSVQRIPSQSVAPQPTVLPHLGVVDEIVDDDVIEEIVDDEDVIEEIVDEDMIEISPRNNNQQTQSPETPSVSSPRMPPPPPPRFTSPKGTPTRSSGNLSMAEQLANTRLRESFRPIAIPELNNFTFIDHESAKNAHPKMKLTSDRTKVSDALLAFQQDLEKVSQTEASYNLMTVGLNISQNRKIALHKELIEAKNSLVARRLALYNLVFPSKYYIQSEIATNDLLVQYAEKLNGLISEKIAEMSEVNSPTRNSTTTGNSRNDFSIEFTNRISGIRKAVALLTSFESRMRNTMSSLHQKRSEYITIKHSLVENIQSTQLIDVQLNTSSSASLLNRKAELNYEFSQLFAKKEAKKKIYQEAKKAKTDLSANKTNAETLLKELLNLEELNLATLGNEVEEAIRLLKIAERNRVPVISRRTRIIN